MNAFARRMQRAARLEAALYQEIRQDPGSMLQALCVVLLSGAAAGIAAMARGGFGGLVSGLLWGVLAWLAGSLVMFYVGTRWFPDENTAPDYGGLLRTLGFATSPGVLRVLGVIPALRGLVFWVVSIWTIAAMVVAVRQTLDYSSSSRAVIVCLMGFVVQIMVGWVFLRVGCATVF